MKTLEKATDTKLCSLPFPLRNAGKARLVDPTEMLRLDLIGSGLNANHSSVTRPGADYAVGTIG